MHGHAALVQGVRSPRTDWQSPSAQSPSAWWAVPGASWAGPGLPLPRPALRVRLCCLSTPPRNRPWSHPHPSHCPHGQPARGPGGCPDSACPGLCESHSASGITRRWDCHSTCPTRGGFGWDLGRLTGLLSWQAEEVQELTVRRPGTPGSPTRAGAGTCGRQPLSSRPLPQPLAAQSDQGPGLWEEGNS